MSNKRYVIVNKSNEIVIKDKTFPSEYEAEQYLIFVFGRHYRKKGFFISFINDENDVKHDIWGF